MDEPGARDVSLWLMPEGESGRRLGALIDRLAARLGTPAFSAATLHVWRTAGCVAQWREIAVLPLAGA